MTREYDKSLLLAFCEWWPKHNDFNPGNYEPEDLADILDAFLAFRSPASPATEQRYWRVDEHFRGGWFAYECDDADRHQYRMLTPFNRPTREAAEADGRSSGLLEWRADASNKREG